jgi:uncharacterized protein
MEPARSLREKLRGLGALPAAPVGGHGADLLSSGRPPEPQRTPYVAPEPPPEPDVEAYLPGFWQDTPEGRIFVVEQRYELDHVHGAIPLGRTLEVSAEVIARIGRHAGLSAVAPERVLYLDTETTGLSGGTGTYAWLVGIGHFIDGGFRLRQYFQTDFGQERALLRALSDYLVHFDAIVTFNGKTFDLPLLETRFTINGISKRAQPQTDVRRLPHLDLLHPARRIYKDRFSSCRLGELEQQVLGLVRHEDVPGWEIPALYFRYVRNRRFRAVLPVFEHNALDILSLVTLTSHLCDFFSGDAARSAEDRFALGRACEADGLQTQSVANYRAALELGLQPSLQHDCEQRLSVLYRRMGRWEEAQALWEMVAQRSNNRQLYPYVELAKYHERVSRDFGRALQATRDGLALLESHHIRFGAAGEADRDELMRRIARLEQRHARALTPRRSRRVLVAEISP